ncbi:4-hydroxythreonine-4-phosphate dehydrogenase [Variovorax sp. CY25R-8]|uniref:4-hydroxythreonine-4-phosphate dehydrogenase n=1 Tax=Variovorax sp. CY25R-8 TaxID=2855501 RepID=UPI0021BAA2E0|nr:4-hydroxythreonine-4-phosphate dehydrogenase [Variovorax sp. CY25R-8]MCT8173651.1 4-hydroxythreonine-4-phosphate dehydrogenase [Variovorax sp. CY25R-8]
MSGFEFIFMLTRHDRTVADAARHLATALAAGVRHIGFKDIGLPMAELEGLHRSIRDHGASSYLEVVSLDRDSEIASVEMACRLGVDHLLGGTHVDDVLPLLEGTGIRYYPFAGRVSGHPSVLGGSIEEIVASARAIESRPGVAGLDLLAYRAALDVPRLMRAVCAAAGKPVIVAGSIDTPERIAAIRASGAAGFTVGTAALDGCFPAPGRSLESQLAAILGAR